MSVEFKSNLAGTTAPLEHAWEYMVGSGRAVLALRAHGELGFRHVRFYGLLDDDMGTLICHAGSCSSIPRRLQVVESARRSKAGLSRIPVVIRHGR